MIAIIEKKHIAEQKSLGNDIKNLVKGVSKQITKTTDGLTSSKKSDKIADRTDEIKADDVALGRINAQKQKGIDRSQKPNMKNGVIVPNKKLSQEQSKDRKPLQNEKKRGDDPRT